MNSLHKLHTTSHVLHVITTIEIGGAENHLLELASELSRLGVRSTVLYLKGRPELLPRFEKIGVHVVDEIANGNILKQILLLRGFLRQNKFDLLHCHLPRASMFTSIANPGLPAIVSFHNSERFWPRAPKFLSKLISRLIHRRFSSGIAISEAVEQFLRNSTELPRAFQVEQIRYGIDSERVKKLAKKNKFSDISKEGRQAIGTICRLEAQKDPFTLIQGFSKLLLRRPNVDLYVVGTGTLLQELKSLVEKLSISDHVHFLGRTNKALSFLANLDVFTLTSQYEGFGLVLLEAMSLEIPIIASDAPAIPEVLGLNHPGLFQRGDSVFLAQKLELALDNQFSQEIVEFQRNRLALFSVEKMGLETLKLYQDIMYRVN